MGHHTKDKGDLGLTAILFDLKKHGINACLPISEHLPFDLIAVSDDGRLSKISVKFRHYRKDTGAIDFTLRSCWADKHGTHTVKHNKSDYDCIAFYCPDTNECYYVKISEIEGETVLIRVIPNKRNIVPKFLAENLKNPQRIF